MDLATLCVLLLGISFAFFNGFHDAGITVGNIVATHGLNPRVALAMATGFNFVGALLGQGIATVIATEVANFPHSSTQLLAVLGGGLAGALLVNVATYFMAVPIASTHVLMGGLVGAWLVVGWDDRPSIMFDETIISIFIMPIVALFASIVLTRVVLRVVASYPPKPLFKRCRQVNSVMVAGLSLAHGSQDAQKIGAVMGLVWGVGCASRRRGRYGWPSVDPDRVNGCGFSRGHVVLWLAGSSHGLSFNGATGPGHLGHFEHHFCGFSKFGGVCFPFASVDEFCGRRF